MQCAKTVNLSPSVPVTIMTIEHAAYVASLTNYELLALQNAVQDELKRRRMTTGVFGEHLALQMYGGALAPANSEGYDLIDSAGRRVEVKSRIANRSEGQLRVTFKSFDGFDACLVLLLDPVSQEPVMARELNRDEIKALRERKPHLHMGHFRTAGSDVLGCAFEAWAAVVGDG